ncbi:hypothetical protein AFE_2376 [Acidithiobacillus ferrooxidans ATCC 23270]|uniref:Uncharacterized protein n=1 Tax=Acidithiobacillus ferrooxidans (strain ATCC 23270 / DSM 14882 / CIP 104768 / NCIMB 8455) TaxID=243159 RepID=B7J6D9_ACIF2|nr:hypothetical protein AFE_2376 [Acidithiobacillus ferrooxidans ATCC 23270]
MGGQLWQVGEGLARLHAGTSSSIGNSCCISHFLQVLSMASFVGWSAISPVSRP